MTNSRAEMRIGEVERIGGRTIRGGCQWGGGTIRTRAEVQGHQGTHPRRPRKEEADSPDAMRDPKIQLRCLAATRRRLFRGRPAAGLKPSQAVAMAMAMGWLGWPRRDRPFAIQGGRGGAWDGDPPWALRFTRRSQPTKTPRSGRRERLSKRLTAGCQTRQSRVRRVARTLEGRVLCDRPSVQVEALGRPRRRGARVEEAEAECSS